MLDFAAWELRELGHPNPRAPRQLKPGEVVDGFYHMPALLFAPGSIHRATFLKFGFSAVVTAHDVLAGRILPPTVNLPAQAAGSAPLLLESGSEEEPRPVSVGGASMTSTKKAIIDSGTSLLAVPTADIKAIVAKVGRS